MDIDYSKYQNHNFQILKKLGGHTNMKTAVNK